MKPQTGVHQLAHWDPRISEVRTDRWLPQALRSINPLSVNYKVLVLEYLDSAVLPPAVFAD